MAGSNPATRRWSELSDERPFAVAATRQDEKFTQ
jgi:hypothetical protein